MIDQRDFPSRRLQIKDEFPESEWRDPRRQYFLEGKSVERLAEEKHTNPRAVKRLILNNMDWDDIGRRISCLEEYKSCIMALLESGGFRPKTQITTLSFKIFDKIRSNGYEGSERTVRNYIRTLEWEAIIKKAAEHDL